MNKDIHIRMPDEVVEKAEELKEFFNVSTRSKAICKSIELAHRKLS